MNGRPGARWLLLVAAIALGSCGGHSQGPRETFARSVVDALAAQQWDRSALAPFLCSDRPSEFKGISFDLYRQYGGIRSIGTIRLLPQATSPAMAMDTFVPVLFNAQFAPYPAMPEHISYRATYLQLQTRMSADGKPCLEGWGRNEIPVDSDQARDFLSNQGIYNRD
jgi:hypothetical protein